MDTRYACNPKDFKHYTTEETRNEFLITNLYKPNEIVAVYSHVDRMVTMGCMPTTEVVDINEKIDSMENFGTNYFLERREVGIFNIGGAGVITVDGVEYPMEYKDCIYITMGQKDLKFASNDAEKPAKFYMVSAPAHKAYTTKKIAIADAAKMPVGESAKSNKRVINQFIHPAVLQTSQLMMGMTSLEEGSIWNTMPCHVHEHRMEIYMYFEIPEDDVVVHLMGQGDETRHLILHNEDAVISPSWSIHAGAGTSNYTFIWAMGGENQTLSDWKVIPTKDLK